MTSLHFTYIPIYAEDTEYTELHSCALDGKDYDETEMVKDDNPYPAVWVARKNVEAYREKMTKELELNEPYKF